jgi:hypothetical protein
MLTLIPEKAGLDAVYEEGGSVSGFVELFAVLVVFENTTQDIRHSPRYLASCSVD